MAESVKSAERVLQIIELLSRSQDGLTFTEVAQALSLPRSSTHSLLATMHRRSFVAYTPESRRYRLGLRLWEAGQSFISALDLPRVAHPYLEAVSKLLAETAQLAVLDGIENVYIDKVDAPQRLILDSKIGGRLPAYATGLGKVLLAALPDKELENRLAGTSLAVFTPRTISNVGALRRELERVRRRDFAEDEEECTPGVYCVAVPIRNHTGEVVAAMSVSVPTIRAVVDARRRILEVLTEQAGLVSAELGFIARSGIATPA